ncbi:MAG: HlyD family efflux transporter periplasmic adaptor subunit, partial [Chloroflexi bacterium]|nr:HlyD family efflux transporter periplasmic adaptor subunit [Chloroflexota bacterium]
TEATATPAAPGPAAAGAPTVVSAEGKIQPAREAKLAFRASGRVAEVLVSEGQPVRAGEVLDRLVSAGAEAAVAQAQAAVAQAQAGVRLAQAQHDQALAGTRPEQIAVLEAQIKASRAAVDQAAAQRNQVADGPTRDTIAAAQAALAAAQSVQKEAQLAYDDVIKNIQYLAGPTEERARYALNAANQQVDAAQATLDRLLQGADPQALAAANSAVNAAAYQTQALEAQLALAQAGPTAEQQAVAQAGVGQAQAALAVARAALQAARTTLDDLRLVAPFDGAVAALNVEVGEVVAPGVPVVILGVLGQWQVVTGDLAETDVVHIRPGQRGTVTLDAFPGQSFPATVREIAALAEANRGNVTYAVTLDLDSTEAGLRWGMTAFADIAIGPK